MVRDAGAPIASGNQRPIAGRLPDARVLASAGGERIERALRLDGMNLETRNSRARRTARARRLAVVALLATSMSACGTNADDLVEGVPVGAATSAPKPAVDEVAFERKAPERDAATAATVAAMREFAADLYKVAAKPGENVVFSPLSIAYAFGMARAGAAGETAAQLDEAFGFGKGRDAAFNALTYGLASSSAPPTPTAAPTAAPTAGPDRKPEKPILTLANALFVKEGYPLLEKYRRAMTEQYGSEVHGIDLANPDEALAEVNGWASEHTAGRIPTIFDKLSPDTRLVIANAVYLKADWTVPFDSAGEGEFAVEGKAVDVPRMSRESEVGYAKGPGWQAVELPYFGDRLVMRVIVPTGSKSPADLMTPAVLAAAAKTKPTVADVTLPKWDFGTKFDLTRLLQQLGVEDAFDGRADFSGIATVEHLEIDQAVHKANITVDELGTVASAVTAVSIKATSARLPAPLQFTVDRPFVFEIVDTKTGAPLFLGHVADPRAK